jgi:hypothetical protein
MPPTGAKVARERRHLDSLLGKAAASSDALELFGLQAKGRSLGRNVTK